MGQRDNLFRPLPGCQADEIDNAVFRHHIRRLCARCRNNIALRKAGEDIGMTYSFFIDIHRRHGEKGFAVFSHIGTRYEVKLSACTADLSGA